MMPRASVLDRRRPLRRLAASLAAATALMLLAQSAEAAPPVAGAQGKRFRLHGDTDLLSFYHYNPDGPGDSYNGGGFGIGRSNLMDAGGGSFVFPAIGERSLAILHQRPVWSIGFGYVFAGDRAIVGGKFAFAIDGYTDTDEGVFDDEARTTLVTGLLVPYFRWMFLPGRRIRPYVGLNFGFGGGASRVDDHDTDAHAVVQQIWPVVGVEGGANFFIVEAVSIDLGVAFEYFAPHHRVELVDADGDLVNPNDDDWDKSGDLINLAGRLGLSVWFG